MCSDFAMSSNFVAVCCMRLPCIEISPRKDMLQGLVNGNVLDQLLLCVLLHQVWYAV